MLWQIGAGKRYVVTLPESVVQVASIGPAAVLAAASSGIVFNAVLLPSLSPPLPGAP
jgi:hypothetical protein